MGPEQSECMFYEGKKSKIEINLAEYVIITDSYQYLGHTGVLRPFF